MTQIACRWDGESFIPVKAHARIADANFVVGETYVLEPVEERSGISHRHYFAAIRDAWSNLPEAAVLQHPSPENLRKTALIKTGYADRRDIVASSKAEALRLAAFIRPMDAYAIVTVTGCVVTVWTARSQSLRAMPNGEFQRSKTAVLEYCATLIGVTVRELEKAAA